MAEGDKLFIDRGGEDRRRHVRFPVRLTVRCGEGAPRDYEDFILNISRGGVFIQSGRPFETGTRLVMHFYIPPEEKLLAEFRGEVVGVSPGGPGRPLGMHVRFLEVSEKDLKRLEDFLEERRHLVDRKM